MQALICRHSIASISALVRVVLPESVPPTIRMLLHNPLLSSFKSAGAAGFWFAALAKKTAVGAGRGWTAIASAPMAEVPHACLRSIDSRANGEKEFSRASNLHASECKTELDGWRVRRYAAHAVDVRLFSFNTTEIIMPPGNLGGSGVQPHLVNRGKHYLVAMMRTI